MADNDESVKLNQELLQATEEPKPAKPQTPKRNSNQALRANILKVVEQYQLDFPFSDTKLKRMNKEQLTKLLAEVMEESVKQDMAKQVGVDPRAPQAVVSLGALRMVHNIMARSAEQGWNQWGAPPTGYQIEGFADSLAHPEVAKTVDECLMEIANENPEVLQYFESPYARLALIWAGVLSTTIRKRDVREIRRRNHQRQAARGAGGGGREEKREERGPHEPRVAHV